MNVNELQELYTNETGGKIKDQDHYLNGRGSFDDDYVEWLEQKVVKSSLGDVSGSLGFNALIDKFIKEELPNANEPYHYEAEIESGMQSFKRWLKDNSH